MNVPYMRRVRYEVYDDCYRSFIIRVSTFPGRQQTSHCFPAQFSRFLVTAEPARLVMEACLTAHYWSRFAMQHGHQVKLLHAHYVRPYVRRNKTDSADADALLRADQDKDLKPVPPKMNISRLCRACTAFVLNGKRPAPPVSVVPRRCWPSSVYPCRQGLKILPCDYDERPMTCRLSCKKTSIPSSMKLFSSMSTCRTWITISMPYWPANPMASG